MARPLLLALFALFAVAAPGVALPAASADTAAPTVPDAPASVTAKSAYAGAGMTVAWTTPADGNSPITGYTVTTNPGGATTTLTAEEVATPYTRNATTIPGLVIGRSYTFSVAAINAVGTGPDSTSDAVPLCDDTRCPRIGDRHDTGTRPGGRVVDSARGQRGTSVQLRGGRGVGAARRDGRVELLV